MHRAFEYQDFLFARLKAEMAEERLVRRLKFPAGDDDAHIGAGSTIRQGISIGEGALVGAGAAVVEDVAPHRMVAGVPAKIMERREAGVPVSR